MSQILNRMKGYKKENYVEQDGDTLKHVAPHIILYIYN